MGSEHALQTNAIQDGRAVNKIAPGHVPGAIVFRAVIPGAG